MNTTTITPQAFQGTCGGATVSLDLKLEVWHLQGNDVELFWMWVGGWVAGCGWVAGWGSCNTAPTGEFARICRKQVAREGVAVLAIEGGPPDTLLIKGS